MVILEELNLPKEFLNEQSFKSKYKELSTTKKIQYYDNLIKKSSLNAKIVKEQHLRFVVKQDKFSFTGIGFNLASKFELLKKPIDLVFTLDENEWNGNTSLQLKVIDLRSSES